MHVLFAVWEVDPFIKVGGLGDVARSLPSALKSDGVDIRLIVPFYKNVNLHGIARKEIATFFCTYAGGKEKITVLQVKHPASHVPVYFLYNKSYFDISTFPDTYAFFCKAIIELVKHDYINWPTDIIHCNDLHTGLVSCLLKRQHIKNVKTIFTIHNLAYQGIGDVNVWKKLGEQYVSGHKGKFINFIHEAIVYADLITTVSPTYAKEILTKKLGCGMQDQLRKRKKDIYGILNGSDIPWKDGPVKRPKRANWEMVKQENKKYLLEKLGWDPHPSAPLFCYIGRFDPHQKGIDILYEAVEELISEDFYFVLLGKGDKEWEKKFQVLSKSYPEKCYAKLAFDDKLAHEIYAASDYIVIPSKYEPCGLVQMIAMPFGTIPIARKTGGLTDSIKDGINGYLFHDYSPDALVKVLKQAIVSYQRQTYKQMVINALATDFSWGKSAKEYIALYRKLLNS